MTSRFCVDDPSCRCTTDHSRSSSDLPHGILRSVIAQDMWFELVETTTAYYLRTSAADLLQRAAPLMDNMCECIQSAVPSVAQTYITPNQRHRCNTGIYM